MLRNLHIKNLALIREADIDFPGGLSILTGETGAGKSIIIDSVSLALGGRITRDLVHEDDSPALIELVFEVTGEDALTGIRKLGYEPEDGVILISRKIQDGRSTIRINGETVTAQSARETAAFLLDIHGQSEHQKLLRPEVQLSLIDRFGGEDLRNAAEQVRKDFKHYASLKSELSSASLSREERLRRMSFLEYEINEIEEAVLVPGEDEELEKRYRRLMNARKLAETARFVHEITGYDSEESAGGAIGLAVKKLESVAGCDERIEQLLTELGEIDDLLNDFNREIADYAGDIEFESGSFEETEERLNVLNRLKAKYGKTVDDVLDALEDKKAEYGGLETYEETRASLEKQFAEAGACLEASSMHLTELRKKAADSFTKEASKQFQELNFARADFSVEFRELKSYTADGKDGIEFCISTNPGEPRRPLRSVVSGGELSRLMLGIRTMFADSDPAETIIFDEVDSGISGRAAQRAAEKMTQLSRGRQVICITHLPQIAAMADAHYGITKDVGPDEAVTCISALDAEESVRELARLIGGAEITANTLSSAREMKEMCRQFKDGDL